MSDARIDLDAPDDDDDARGDRGLLPAGALVGSYRIERAIAEGGMATVYEATHDILPRRAAVKVLHRYLLGTWSTRERLFQEARILEALRHPGIVRILDAGVLADERPWIAMELLDGLTLAQRILLRGSLDVLEVIDVLDGTLAALDAAHAQGVVHRDLKPENLILQRTAAGVAVKVIDWGIARVQGGDAGCRLTRANMTPGTPLYMSPEQARGRAVDGRSDVYALGVIACEALCGEPPFRGATPLDVVIQHLTTEPPPPSRRRPDLPAALDALVLGMLAKEPEDRPSVDAIRAVLGGLARTLRGRAAAPAELPAGASDGVPEEIAYDELTIELEVDLDDEPEVEAAAGAVIELPAIPRARWTPDDAALRPRAAAGRIGAPSRRTMREPLAPRRAARVVAPSPGREAVAGEITTTRRLRRSQAGAAEVLGLALTAVVTALMLASALAAPALRLDRATPVPIVPASLAPPAVEPVEPVEPSVIDARPLVG